MSYARSFLLGIGGGAGAGKTTLAKRLAALCPERALLLSCDDYYRSIAGRDPRDVNFDVPDSVDYPLLKDHLRALARGESVPTLKWTYGVGRSVDLSARLEPKPIVIVEGILVFADDELRNMFDLSVYVDAPADVRAARRLLRDTTPVEQGGRGLDLREEVDRCLRTVFPAHEEFVERARAKVDVVVNGANPRGFEPFARLVKSAFDSFASEQEPRTER